MDDVIQKVVNDLLALSKDMDGQDAHGQHAARLYARLKDRPLPPPTGTVFPDRGPATQAE